MDKKIFKTFYRLKITETKSKSKKTTNKSVKVKPKQLIKLGGVKKPIYPLKQSELFEFSQIEQLNPVVVQALDKNRNDIRNLIEKTVRTQQAFIRQLTKQSSISHRIRHIIRITEEVNFYCEVQRDLLERHISELLKGRITKRSSYDPLK